MAIKNRFTASPYIVQRVLDGSAARNMIALNEFLPGDVADHRIGAKLSIGYLLVHGAVEERVGHRQLARRTGFHQQLSIGKSMWD
eukprot:5874120-Pyramimonas_sp.AAC.2